MKLSLAPYLVAFYPLVFIYANNFKEMKLWFSFRAVIVVFALVWLLSKLINLVIRDRVRAILILSVLIFFVFSFGHLSDLVPYFEPLKFGPIIFGKNKLVFLASVIPLAGITWKILTSKKISGHLVSYVTSVYLILIAISLGKMGVTLVKPGNTFRPANNNEALVIPGQNLPDIYYIILDGYARDDVLQELYDYRNNQLTGYLRLRGFYVANESRANYVYTYASLATSLNLNYLEALGNNFDQLIQDNLVAQKLKTIGYRYLTFRSGFPPLESNVFADRHYRYSFGLNIFEEAVVDSSLFHFLLNLTSLNTQELHRQRVLFTLKTLEDISRDPRLTFTFAHIISPHPPFVFDKYGQGVGGNQKYGFVDGVRFSGTKDEYKIGYLNQLMFIDGRVITTLEKILHNSETPPVIIIQGDHGPSSEINWNNKKITNTVAELIDNQNPLSVKERSSILNAYYVPQKVKDKLFPSISPVNSFRVLFNELFGQNFELLKDVTFTDK